MAKLKIYGPALSRATRPVWAARELGLDFERIDVSPEFKAGDYGLINPNRRFPALQDGEVTLFESLAITLYLARTYGQGTLYPSTAAGEALTHQWTLWATNELESRLVTCMLERTFKPPGEGDLDRADEAEAAMQRPLAVLDAALEGRDWLVEDRFTVCDLNVGAVIGMAGYARVDVDAYPNVRAFVARCTARPANRPAT